MTEKTMMQHYADMHKTNVERDKSSRGPVCYVDGKSLMNLLEEAETNQVGIESYLLDPEIYEICQDILLIGLAMSTGNICPYIAGNTTVSCEIDYEYST